MFDRGLLDPIMAKDSGEDVESREGASALLQVVVEAFVSQSALDNVDIITGIMNRSAGEAVIARTMQQENGCFVVFPMPVPVRGEPGGFSRNGWRRTPFRIGSA